MIKFRDLLNIMDDYSSFLLVIDSNELCLTPECVLMLFKESILDRGVVRLDKGRIYLDGGDGNA